MWPGQRGDTKGQPFHPNLRLRWAENFGITNIFTRISFALLLGAALSVHAFVFSSVWRIPPLVAILLNVRIAYSMKNRTWRDVVFAATALPTELSMWPRAGTSSAPGEVLVQGVDNWAEQAKAQRGSGDAYLMPLVVLAVCFLVHGYTWFQLPVMIQASVRWLGSRPLHHHHRADRCHGGKLFRRQRGYQV
jgi:hypothetical protein